MLYAGVGETYVESRDTIFHVTIYGKTTKTVTHNIRIYIMFKVFR